MTDLLQDALDGLGTWQRDQINLDLARIQNCDNVSRDRFAPWPAFDLRYAVHREAQCALKNVQHDWDYGYAVRGLS